MSAYLLFSKKQSKYDLVFLSLLSLCVSLELTFIVMRITRKTTKTAPNTPHKMLTNGLGGSFLRIITTFILVTRIYETKTKFRLEIFVFSF